MTSQIEISGIKYEIDENTKKYVEKRIGKLVKYLPRHAKKYLTNEEWTTIIYTPFEDQSAYYEHIRDYVNRFLAQLAI